MNGKQQTIPPVANSVLNRTERMFRVKMFRITAIAVSASALSLIPMSTTAAWKYEQKWTGPSAVAMPVGPLPNSVTLDLAPGSNTGTCNNNATTSDGYIGTGASGNDDTACLQAAFDAGGRVYIPPGIYYFSQTLKLKDVYVDGAGPDSTVLVSVMQTSDEPIQGTGNNWALGNVTILSDYKGPRTVGWFIDVNPTGAVPGNSNWQVDHVKIIGGPGAGIGAYGGSHGYITNNTIEATLADCIGMYNGASYWTVSNNLIMNCGDDGISNVTYADSKSIVSNNTISNNVVISNYWGRNFSAVGAENITFTNNYAKGNASGISCLIIEADEGASTDGSTNIIWKNGTLDGSSPAGNCGDPNNVSGYGYPAAFTMFGYSRTSTKTGKTTAYPNSAIFADSYITNPGLQGIALKDDLETLALTDYALGPGTTASSFDGAKVTTDTPCTKSCRSIGYQPQPVGANGQIFIPPRPSHSDELSDGNGRRTGLSRSAHDVNLSTGGRN